jgi:CHAD domain-containing protein
MRAVRSGVRWAKAVRQFGKSSPEAAAHLPLLRLLSELGVAPRDVLVAYQLADAVALQSARFHKLCARCRRSFSEESVHDARVHCRRLIARISLVHEAMPNSALESVIRALKRFLKPLGELRDVQVQKQALTEELTRFPEVAGLWIELGKQEKRLARAAGASIRGFAMGKLDRRLEALESELTDPCARLAAKTGLHEAVVRALEEAYRVVLQRRRQIDPALPATVHRVRIAYKKFRYMVESLPPAVGKASELQLAAMAHYQTALGNVQDVEVLGGFVSDYLHRFPKLGPGLEQFQGHLVERQDGLIGDYLNIADTLASFWPLPSPPPEL